MAWDRPIYVMIKPPRAVAMRIAGLRATRGIPSLYDRDRLHCTLLPLGDEGGRSAAEWAAIGSCLANVEAEPFDIVFDTLQGYLLRSRTSMAGAQYLYEAVFNGLRRGGFAVKPKPLWLHMTLHYAPERDRPSPIKPIAWRVEEFSLIRSVRGRGEHDVLGVWPLANRQLPLAL